MLDQLPRITHILSQLLTRGRLHATDTPIFLAQLRLYSFLVFCYLGEIDRRRCATERTASKPSPYDTAISEHKRNDAGDSDDEDEDEDEQEAEGVDDDDDDDDDGGGTDDEAVTRATSGKKRSDPSSAAPAKPKKYVRFFRRSPR